MIFFPEMKALAKCEASEYPAAAPMVLILSATGSFAGAADGWQFLSDGSVFRSFCPDHHQELKQPLIQPGFQLGPRGLRPVNGRRG